jgi:hypothetical protein
MAMILKKYNEKAPDLALIGIDVNSYPGTGSNWFDVSGNGNDYILENTTFSDGKITFSGSAPRAIRPNFLRTTATDKPFSVAIKVLWTSTQEWQCLFEVGETNANFGNQQYHIFINFGNKIYINPQGSASTSDHLRTPAELVTNTEYGIVTTFDGATHKIYVDGVEKASLITGVKLDKANTYMGSRFGTLPLQGYIKDCRVYDRALAAEEVAGIFSAPYRKISILSANNKILKTA